MNFKLYSINWDCLYLVIYFQQCFPIRPLRIFLEKINCVTIFFAFFCIIYRKSKYFWSNLRLIWISSFKKLFLRVCHGWLHEGKGDGVYFGGNGVNVVSEWLLVWLFLIFENIYKNKKINDKTFKPILPSSTPHPQLSYRTIPAHSTTTFTNPTSFTTSEKF